MSDPTNPSPARGPSDKTTINPNTFAAGQTTTGVTLGVSGDTVPNLQNYTSATASYTPTGGQPTPWAVPSFAPTAADSATISVAPPASNGGAVAASIGMLTVNLQSSTGSAPVPAVTVSLT